MARPSSTIAGFARAAFGEGTVTSPSTQPRSIADDIAKSTSATVGRGVTRGLRCESWGGLRFAAFERRSHVAHDRPDLGLGQIVLERRHVTPELCAAI